MSQLLKNDRDKTAIEKKCRDITRTAIFRNFSVILPRFLDFSQVTVLRLLTHFTPAVGDLFSAPKIINNPPSTCQGVEDIVSILYIEKCSCVWGQMKGKISGKFPFSRLNPPCVYDRRLQFSSPHGLVQFPSISNFK